MTSAEIFHDRVSACCVICKVLISLFEYWNRLASLWQFVLKQVFDILTCWFAELGAERDETVPILTLKTQICSDCAPVIFYFFWKRNEHAVIIKLNSLPALNLVTEWQCGKHATLNSKTAQHSIATLAYYAYKPATGWVRARQTLMGLFNRPRGRQAGLSSFTRYLKVNQRSVMPEH